MKHSYTELGQLCVIDKLEVGPVKLESRKVTADYRVVVDGQSEVNPLVYRYEQDIFDPLDPHDQNLAAMMTAQVALNYSLFCREIVFHGIFENQDRRFLCKFAENTAREILVKKLLQPNPFLPEVHLEPQVKKHYGCAKLRFPQMRGSSDLPWRSWPVRRAGHAVLSSGGKDSLLSYGLLREMGLNPHSVFINESGRHWFTALNAYRGLKHLDTTHRVWCNSDRIFNWMLRRLPFVRSDFSDLRADIYPIRLWSVAVFLFGALPLMKKHGLARLIIGDEFDTSTPSSHHGIKHYDGLFDQSRFFDHELSRYFMAKGWAIRQFSLLRPCSEMLIETILAKRYPDLLKWQTSCHATHKQGDRIVPCGRCEKCRRIVGMLLAIDVNPEICGYHSDAIAACLKALASSDLKQEQEAASHLLYLLTQKGHVEAELIEAQHRRPHPEVMQLRFDPGISPWTDIPVDLRHRLYELMSAHADGCVERKGSNWARLDLSKRALDTPYAFEHDLPEQGLATRYLWGEMTWPEAGERLKVTEGLFTFVAITNDGKPRAVPPT